jgi:hypothetical protein
MANQEHLNILAKGVGTWNAWREENINVVHDFNRANLRGASLRGIKLSRADLRGADLSGAELGFSDLSRASLNGATFSNANLGEADLSRSDLSGAMLSDARLHGAQLSGAVLVGANLRRVGLGRAFLNGADLQRADLTGAEFGYTACNDVDLSTVKGLDTAKHAAPSSIGIDSIYRSNGKIPEIFLRGAGVPENFIAYMKSLTGAALDFYSCFISYSTADQAFADRLHADLQARGVRCWFSPHDIQGGRKLHEQIDEAIKVYDKLLLILSDASMSSNWVKTEIANARAKEVAQERQMLYPIRLVPFERIKGWKLFDADTGIDSAREIREYFVPDFSNWKDHDSYTKAFERLVRDLKAQPGDKAAAQGSERD